ncbi:hypothetical protein [uncultured Chryseobacterium sp.]|uniref:hypothetical protein n=1 Tax=uncultured Chryseobacterium sp. TaxID=259322 RepID=UPI0037484605
MKNILIIMHDYAGIPDLMKKNLTYSGFDHVDFMFYSEEKFKYSNLSQKINNFYRKIIYKDKKYKEDLRLQFIEDTLIRKAERIPQYDLILMLNTDLFPDRFLEIIRTKTTKLIGNHWDGLGRTPQIYSKIKFFDRFFVFDQDDVDEKKNIFFLTNFFFDFDTDLHAQSEGTEQDVFYIGTYVPERYSLLKNISTVFSTQDISQKIMLFSWDKKDPDGNITFTDQFISYQDNMDYVRQSKALLDLKLKAHNGLSFRFFESLKYDRKLITDNPTVKSYDFYTPENIFIINEDSEASLKNFIRAPYKAIPEDIKNKYSFTHWFNTLTSSR